MNPGGPPGLPPPLYGAPPPQFPPPHYGAPPQLQPPPGALPPHYGYPPSVPHMGQPGAHPTWLPAPPGPLPPPHSGVLPMYRAPVTLTRPAMTPRPGPSVPTSSPASTAITPAARSTTIYVGKIAATVADELIMQLLESCGEVKSWNRQRDPETKQLKAFGFCEMGDAEAVMRALRILNGREVHNQELLVKTNQATQKYIEHYQAVQKLLEKQKAAAAAARSEKAGHGNEGAGGVAENDAGAAETTVKNGKTEGGDAAAAAGEVAEGDEGKDDEEPKKLTDEEALQKVLSLLEAPGSAPPPPPPSVHDATGDGASEFLSNVLGGGDGGMGRPGTGGAEHERELQRQVEKEKVRERERRKEEMRIVGERELQLDRIERDRDHERRRLERREKDMERDRQRQLKDDMEMDSDCEEPLYRRRPYAGSARAKDRRKRREAELAEDAALICREEEQAKARAKAEEEAAAKEAARLVEEAAAAAKAEEIAQAQEIAKAEAEKLHPGASNGNVKSEGAEEDRAASGQAATAAPKLDPAADPIYAAMIAAAKTVPPKPESPAAALEPVGLTTQPPAKKKRVGINPAVLAAFKEEEEKPRMALPAFTMEPMVEAARRDRWDKSNNKDPPKDIKEELKKIADSIPTTKASVFKHEIGWDVFEKHKLGATDKPICRFVKKKVAELLGSEEDYVINFILEKLASQATAQEMLDELNELFEDQAETFVLKLYRMVIFETQKSALLSGA